MQATERIRLDLEADEYEALLALARRELRPLPDQARYLLRQALRRRGLLPSTPAPAEARR